MPFSGKVVLITGGSSTIGAITAVEFSSLNANVAITCLDNEGLKEVAERCKTEPFMIVGDLLLAQDVENIIQSVIKHYGKLDVLVNNAGLLECGGIDDTNMEQFDRIFNINIRAAFHLTKLAVPYLTKTKGNIVNVSSRCGLRASITLLAYSMSKTALDHFTTCAALDLASHHVRVNSVNPGVVLTDFIKDGGLTSSKLNLFLENTKLTHPLGRPGSPEEVAKAIAFLADDNKASYITGISLPVDGGNHQVFCTRW